MQQARPPAEPIPAPRSLSPSPRSNEGISIVCAILVLFAFDLGPDKYFGVRVSTPPSPLLSLCTLLFGGGLAQPFWLESGHTAVLSVSALACESAAIVLAN